jgi:hypothetical protein
MTIQEFTSAKTSINSKRLPAIYNKLNWSKLRRDSVSIPPVVLPVVLDVGAGKHIEHIEKFVESQGFAYAPYDPYNLPKDINRVSLRLKPAVVICSNVFNVIKEKEVHYEIHKLIRDKNCPFFITIYEGDRSLAGHPTMNNQCYQRNETIDTYLMRWDEIIYKKVITLPDYKKYIQY